MTDPIKVALSILRKSPGDYYCISTKSGSGRWKDNFFARKDITKIPEFVKANKKADIYMCPQGLSRSRRHKSCVIPPYTLFADLDECNPNELKLKPTVALESSPGRYVGYWFLDKPATEDLNRRLSYSIGADKSGWDFSQVLRFPGTINHKYDSRPVVKVLWNDGPRYKLDKLDSTIPQIVNAVEYHGMSDAQKIYESYERDMPRAVRRELTNPRPKHGKRSDVLWWMTQELVEIGMSKDEVFVLLWDNAWNKHRNRRDGDQQLRREIDKAVSGHVQGTKKKEPVGKFFDLTPMSEVKQEQHDWLIPDMIARGETVIFEGDPGVGKSYFLMWLAIHFCDGKRLPWDKSHGKTRAMKVAYCDTENSMATVTKARLTDNGLRNEVNYIQVQELFSIKEERDLNALEREVIIDEGIDVLIIDPVNPYLGDTDNYNAKDVQQSLQELKMMAKEHKFALIIVRHLNKSKNSKALYAGGGSIGFAGLARVVATVGWHPEDEGLRVVACTKNNLSMPFKSLSFTIDALPDTLERSNRSELLYEGTVDLSSDDIVSTIATKKGSDSDVVGVAVSLIKKYDDLKEIDYQELMNEASKRSISVNTMKEAIEEAGLKIVSVRRGTKIRKMLKRVK